MHGFRLNRLWMSAWVSLVCFGALSAEVRVWDGYPPPPQRLKTRVDVAAYIFPGWYRDKGRGDYPYRTHDEESEWRLVAAKPAPRPLLGFYDDSLPEVNDWHIKWALEHGVSTFVFDWYWNAGEHRLLRSLEQGFLKAKYASMMTFCIHWCNHGLDWRTRQWYPMMGLADAVVEEGVVRARITSGDPAFACSVQLKADDYTHAYIRMKLSAGNGGQLFWGGTESRESEANSLSFETFADDDFHEYTLDLRTRPGWRGEINRMRFDPNGGCPESRVALDCIRLLKSSDPEGEGMAWDFSRAGDFGGLTAGGLDLGRRALLEMTDYMAEHYFALPNYLRIGGRPTVYVWDPRAVIKANGGPQGFRESLAAMNAGLRRRGMEDLYLVSMYGGPDIVAAGFSALTGYGYYGVDFDAPYEWRGGYSVPYDLVVSHYEGMWRGHLDSASLPYIVPIGSNWDSRPRAGDGAAVITGKTPELFRRMCQGGLSTVREPLNMAVFEAWNEWGEGSFIEPDKEWGFAFLDVVREVFGVDPAEHEDMVPSPARIASFSVLSAAEVAAAQTLEDTPFPPPPRYPRSVQWVVDKALVERPVRRQWEFDGASTEGWETHQLGAVDVAAGCFSATAEDSDPQMIVDQVAVEIAALDTIALRLRVSEGVSQCQVFWSTDEAPEFSAQKSFFFALSSDGEWHTYHVTKKPEGAWQGRLKGLRFDMGRPGDRIEVDWIRLLGRTGE